MFEDKEYCSKWFKDWVMDIAGGGEKVKIGDQILSALIDGV